eukprot:scaffold201838_cov15-Prasinocladus_malaysianus.AAC.1
MTAGNNHPGKPSGSGRPDNLVISSCPWNKTRHVYSVQTRRSRRNARKGGATMNCRSNTKFIVATLTLTLGLPSSRLDNYDSSS